MLLKKTFFTVFSTAILIAGCSSSSDDGATENNVSDSAVIDPAPEFENPGEYGCENCPDIDVGLFARSTSDSVTTFTDVVNDAVGEGQFYNVSENGAAISGVIPTDASGLFQFSLPLFCGVQIIKCVWSNESGTYVLVTEVTREDCVDADIQVTLNWDDLGQDFELHLIKPGGMLNDNATDCTWTSCIGKGPDWGVLGDVSDDPRKDVDDTGSYGPENIYLAKPENGTYTVIVEHWGSGMPDSRGEVILNIDGKSTVVTSDALAPQSIWTVGTIEWPSKKFTPDGAIINCTENWSGGCKLPLPQASDT